jgi:hypothetical protein
MWGGGGIRICRLIDRNYGHVQLQATAIANVHMECTCSRTGNLDSGTVEYNEHHVHHKNDKNSIMMTVTQLHYKILAGK